MADSDEGDQAHTKGGGAKLREAILVIFTRGRSISLIKASVETRGRQRKKKEKGAAHFGGAIFAGGERKTRKL